MIVTFVILGLAVVAFVSNRVPLGVVAIGVSLALFFTGVLTLPEALAGFGDPTVLFVAAMFVVSESLDANGITTWAGRQLLSRAGTKRIPLVLAIAVLAAILSAVVSVTGAVAALVPLVVVVAARAGIPSSQLLIPLAFVAHAGSMLLLTGTPVNVIVSEVAADSGGRPIGFLEFALVGIPLVIGTVAVVLLLGPRLLPLRTGTAMPVDLAAHARLLRDEYAVTLDTGVLMGAARGITEVIVPPRSSLIGTQLSLGMATPSGDLVLLGARRGEAKITASPFTAEAGDALLLQGSWDDLAKHTAGGRRILALDAPTDLRRSAPLDRRAIAPLVILGLMIIALASGIVPPAAAALVAACLLVLTRSVGIEQAYRSISWTTVVLIAGMIPMSTAFFNTGAADFVANQVLAVVGDAAPTLVLLVLCLITVVLSQLISNAATVLILAPVAVALSQSMGVSVMPFMLALTVAGAACFFTPIATPANLIVMAPGGYRFGDYWKLGLPLGVLFLAIAVFYVPLVWPF
ncbi:SLC13 family permease [Microbacterium sediminicola]